ncbi:MAG: hypothetical protein WKG07_31160 [Hymenobacter sp.]
MVGYLHAIQKGAQVIIDTDDDNIPYDGWQFPATEGTFATAPADKGFVNIYKNFTSHHIWPRGYPLDLILNADHNLKEEELTQQEAKIGIWQGLADSDPDVDAIYRLVDNTEIFFDKRAPIVLPEGTLCPFNSQNTMIRRELFPLLYLPAYVTFRFTDILRGLVAQPIMWAHGYRLGFTEATVIQVRNPHDYVKDFRVRNSLLSASQPRYRRRAARYRPDPYGRGEPAPGLRRAGQGKYRDRAGDRIARPLAGRFSRTHRVTRRYESGISFDFGRYSILESGALHWPHPG